MDGRVEGHSSQDAEQPRARRRHWLVIALWLVAIGSLAGIGLGVEERLHRTTLSVPGTGAERADRIVTERFGNGSTLSVLLRGPEAALEEQGPRIAERLGATRGVDVLSPWTGAPGETLRPKPESVLMILRVGGSYDDVSAETVTVLRERLAAAVRPPLKSHLTGYADIGAGIERETLTALSRAELIAGPLLLLILLAVFRSPIAAGLPLLLGLTTIAAARGFVSLVNSYVVDLDAVALNLASMIGLALGVDYSLLMVSRFREELAAGASPYEAAATTAATAGRTVRFAGIALGVAALAAYFVSPGNVLASGSAGILGGTLLSVAAAVTALPAMLALIGTNIDRWSFGRARRDQGRWGGLAWRVVRRPAPVAALIFGALCALSVPALALNGGPPDPRSMPADSPERQDFEAVADTLGGGWSAPYEIVVQARRGTVTDPERLAALDRWQTELARDERVVAVFGPAQVRDRVKPLEDAPRQLADAGRKAKRGQARLDRGLERLDGGMQQVRSGLSEAATGAERLAQGAAAAQAGAAPLQAGLDRAADAAGQVRAGLAKARRGAAELVAGARREAAGAARLRRSLSSAKARTAQGRPRLDELARGLRNGRSDLEKLREPAQLSERELREALQALDRMTVLAKGDPQYRSAYESVATALGAISGKNPVDGKPVREGYDGLDPSLARAADGLGRAADGVDAVIRSTRDLQAGFTRLADGARALERGADELLAGAKRLEDGAARLGEGTAALDGGVSRLADGGDRLAGGIAQLSGGAGRLASGLDEGHRKAGALDSGVDRLEEGVEGFSPSRLGDPSRIATVLRSGYAALAAVETAPDQQRTAAGFAVNVDRGGSAARVVVIERENPVRDGNPLRQRLERDADRVAAATGMDVAVGGAAATLQDFDTATMERLPLLILALVVATYLVLIPILRSLLLPLVAVVLNVLTVGAAFGVLVLCFQGSAPLGGPGFIDAIMVMGIFSVVFGLSIDYEVFLLARMREGWLKTGRTDEAISYGLDRTAAVITGAALIMTAVFVAFAASEMSNLRQYGIGLTVAVILDATLVRLVLLPAVLRLLGDRVWWMPAWLDRVVPDVHVEGKPAATG